MSEHPIEGMMSNAMEKIREMVDVNTIIGEPITSPDGTVIIPVSKVTYGFASGGSDFPTKKPEGKDLFGGGSGAGITISPVAFLTVSNGNVNLLQISPYDGPADRVISMVPEVVDKLGAMLKKSREEKKSAREKKTGEAVKTETTVKVEEIKLDDPQL